MSTLFQSHRALLAGNFGEAGEFVDQIALAHAPQRKGEFGPKRNAVDERRQRKANQCSGEGAAENDDEGVLADEHMQVAAHQNHEANDRGPCQQAKTCRNIHNLNPTPHGLCPNATLLGTLDARR
jgi:hypothetical protein